MTAPYNTPSAGPARPRPDVDELAAPATQVVRDRDAYLGQSPDVGRRLTDDQIELFVGDDAALALQREFERLQPQYIALHDVGTSSSLRLLQSMAATTGKVMRLTVRRQGHGVALATLRFVEIKGSDGSVLRVYSTDIDADTHGRHEIARVLLAHARLAVMVFGDLPPHALGAALQPLSESLSHGRWPNRHLLMVPLGATTALKGFGDTFTERGVQVQVAPRVARATDAWSLIGTAWNQLDGLDSRPAPAPPAPAPGATAAAAAAAARAEARTQPMGLATDRAAPAPREQVNWYDYAHRCISLKGMISCCVFNRADGHSLAHAGGRPPAEVMQALGERLLATAGDMGAMLGTGAEVNEATVSYASHHIMLRALPRYPGLVLHAMVDASTGNLAVLRAQLQRLDPA